MTLTYKTFTWPQNPHSYRDQMERQPRYRDNEGEKLFQGLSPVLRTITGEGKFYGPDAAVYFRQLEALLGDVEPGYLVHSQLGRVYCYFTGLELTQEAKADVISYRFVFTGALDGGGIPA